MGGNAQMDDMFEPLENEDQRERPDDFNTNTPPQPESLPGDGDFEEYDGIEIGSGPPKGGLEEYDGVYIGAPPLPHAQQPVAPQPQQPAAPPTLAPGASYDDVLSQYRSRRADTEETAPPQQQLPSESVREPSDDTERLSDTAALDAVFSGQRNPTPTHEIETPRADSAADRDDTYVLEQLFGEHVDYEDIPATRGKRKSKVVKRRSDADELTQSASDDEDGEGFQLGNSQWTSPGFKTSARSAKTKQSARSETDSTDSGDDEDAPRPKKKKKQKETSRAKTFWKVFIPLTLLIIVLAVLLVVAEPWVPAEDAGYTEPELKVIGTQYLTVGGTLELNQYLGENEQLNEIEYDEQLITLVDTGSGPALMALGEWERSDVRLHTGEIQVPERTLKEISIFGLDATKPYNNLRDFLRRILGIEDARDERTELRDIGYYELRIVIQGHPTIKNTEVLTLYTGEELICDIGLGDGERVLTLRVSPQSAASVMPYAHDVENEERYGVVAKEEEGPITVSAAIGFMKDGKFVTQRTVEFAVNIMPSDEADENEQQSNYSYITIGSDGYFVFDEDE